MKFLLLPLLLVTQAMAVLPSFYLERDGVNYLCQATATPNPGGNIACVDKAYSGPFSREESIQLCRGSFSIAPAECAVKLYAGPFSKAESLRACSGAISIGPADCAIKLYAGPFSKEETLQVCGRLATLAHADCALKAYAGPYSKSEAIEICRSDIANNARVLPSNRVQLMSRSLNKPAEVRSMQQIKMLESQSSRLQKQMDIKR